jgi:ribosomal protein S18 acetylase RimI-like enzyme
MTSSHTDELYRLQKRDIASAAAVLVDAFQHDPVWNAVLRDTTPEQRAAVFETPVRYCLHYGEAYAPSESLEGVAAWVPGKVAAVTPWRALLSGVMWTGFRMGPNLAKRVARVFEAIEQDRAEHTHGLPSYYLQIVGVAPEFQGQGFGGKLIRALIEKCERENAWLYLETETEGNVRLYEHLGFSVVKEIRLREIDLPMWEMMREP